MSVLQSRNAAARQPSAPGRAVAFDLVRLFAALVVVLDHFAFSSHAVGRTELHSSLLSPVIRYGYFVLDVFFIVSGYFVLMTAKDRDWRSFAIARMARVYPALIACATITFIGCRILSAYSYRSVGALAYLGNISGLVLLPGVSHRIPVMDVVYWTIQIEVGFYVLVAVGLAIGLVQRRFLAVLLAACALTTIVSLLMPHQGLVFFVAQWISRFVFGGILFVLSQKPRSRANWALAASAVVLMMISMWQRSIEREALEHAVFNPFIACGLLLAAIVVLTWIALRPVRRVFPLTEFAGGMTYPLYLIHHQLGCALARALGLGDSLAAVFAMTAGMMVLAGLIHGFVERPLVPRLRRSLTAMRTLRRAEGSTQPTAARSSRGL